MGIKHADVKTSKSVGLSSEWNKDHIVDGDIDMNQYSLTNNVIENRASWPAGPVEGQIIFRTDLNQFYIWNGSDWDIYNNIKQLNMLSTEYNWPFINIVDNNNDDITGDKITFSGLGLAAADKFAIGSDRGTYGSYCKVKELREADAGGMLYDGAQTESNSIVNKGYVDNAISAYMKMYASSYFTLSQGASQLSIFSKSFSAGNWGINDDVWIILQIWGETKVNLRVYDGTNTWNSTQRTSTGIGGGIWGQNFTFHLSNPDSTNVLQCAEENIQGGGAANHNVYGTTTIKNSWIAGAWDLIIRSESTNPGSTLGAKIWVYKLKG